MSEEIMLERRALLAGGAMAAAVTLLSGRAAAQHQSMKGMSMMSMQECIDLCWASHRMCLETLDYALKRGGALASPALAAMLSDCAELCQTTANSMLRGSPLHQILCRACAKACERCAQACLEHRADQQMSRCAQTCSACAEGCRAMGGMDH